MSPLVNINNDFYIFAIMFSQPLLSEQLGFRYRTVVIVNPFQESNQAAALFNFVIGSIRVGRSDSLRPGRSGNRIWGGGDFSLRDQTGPGAEAWC
jgi:hypothetical protein